MIDAADLPHLERCLDLAAEALAAGDQPFGAVLVGADGRELAADRQRVATGDPTRHPELALARVAADRLSPAERSAATLYCSTEPCPMCAGALGWVGIGRIVIASTASQLAAWAAERGRPPAPVRPLPGARTDTWGPVTPPAPEVRRPHRHVGAGDLTGRGHRPHRSGTDRPTVERRWAVPGGAATAAPWISGRLAAPRRRSSGGRQEGRRCAG